MNFFKEIILAVCVVGFVLGKKEFSNELQPKALEYPLPPGYRRWDDMILPDSFFDLSSNESRNAINNQELKWPRAQVPYVIDNSLSYYRNNIYQAFQEYHSKTCVRFVPRGNEHRNYINIFSGDGCYSLIGRANQGPQPVSLGRGCTDHGTIVHELGHAIGFHHEQNRSDRDNHLIINWGNIQQGYGSQFNALYPGQNWLINGFDVNSIMLYGAIAFSKDRYSPTMVHRGGQRLIEVYQKKGLSYADVQRVNRLYGC